MNRFRMTLDMIKFEHSIFALPFALTGAWLALRSSPLALAGAAPRLLLADAAPRVLWIIAAMIGARSAAMAFNRLADAAIDARNPRTASRHLPAGLLTRGYVWMFLGGSTALFVLASAMLGPLCLKLAPAALALLFTYSYTKRFTALSHLVLGLCLGVAPMAAWIAITGQIEWRLLWLTAAVAFWTAGFDIIYACQDEQFDRTSGLHSIPAALGIARALHLSRALHILMIVCLCVLWIEFGLGALALFGIALVAALLIYEHRLVHPGDLSKVNAAFFTMNGWVSILFFLTWLADTLFTN
jgi:4-hydroxybenzoate polyprenyltransferase